MIGILLTLVIVLVYALSALGVRQASEQAQRSAVRVRSNDGAVRRAARE